MRAVLKAQIDETDLNDARGIAQMMRVGLYRPGACEDATQSETADVADPSQAVAVEGYAIENDLRGTCVTSVSRSGWSGGRVEAHIKELVENLPELGRSGRIAGHCPAGASRADQPSCIAACLPSSGTMTCAGV